ncbi:hypothetical protein ACQ4LE_009333 [Meloidogyne hapla]
MQKLKFLKIPLLIFLLLLKLQETFGGNYFCCHRGHAARSERSNQSNVSRSNQSNGSRSGGHNPDVDSPSGIRQVEHEYLFKDIDYVKHPHHPETSNSQVNGQTCPCGEFNIEDFDGNETVKIDEHPIEFKVKKIGSGEYSNVYHAILTNEGNEECVSLKVSHLTDERKNEIAKNEIDILNELKDKDAGIIKYYGSEIRGIGDQRKAFIVMENGWKNLVEYIDWIKKHGIKKEILHEQIKNVVIGAAKALEKFHINNGIHLDIKPENFVVIKRPDNMLTVKLIDFGFSFILPEGHEEINLERRKGTKGYMAPELFKNNKITQKADIYSFAIMILMLLYPIDEELVSPGRKNEFVDLRKHMPPPKYFEDVNNSEYRLDRAMRKCSEKSPNARPSLSDVIKHLNGERELY